VGSYPGHRRIPVQTGSGLSRRAWITAIIAVIAVVLVVRFGLSFPWSRTFDMLATADWLLLTVACLMNILSLAAKAGAWYLLLRRVGPVRLASAQAATFVGAAVNSISISISGEAARAQHVVTGDHLPLKSTVASLFVSRVVESLALIVFLAGAFIVLPPWAGARPIGVALGLTAALVILGYNLVPWTRLGSRPLGHWRQAFLDLTVSKNRGGLTGALAFAALNWVAQWFTYHWSIAATHVAVTPAVSLATLVAANLAGILRLTPGNIGVLQGSMVLGMRAFQIPAADALAAGLALQAVQVLPVLIIGFAIAGRRGLRRLAAAKQVEAL
jgi:uncharacterized membrane protein YbhN (UPF0104 family)